MHTHISSPLLRQHQPSAHPGAILEAGYGSCVPDEESCGHRRGCIQWPEVRVVNGRTTPDGRLTRRCRFPLLPPLPTGTAQFRDLGKGARNGDVCGKILLTSVSGLRSRGNGAFGVAECTFTGLDIGNRLRTGRRLHAVEWLMSCCQMHCLCFCLLFRML